MAHVGEQGVLGSARAFGVRPGCLRPGLSLFARLQFHAEVGVRFGKPGGEMAEVLERRALVEPGNRRYEHGHANEVEGVVDRHVLGREA